MLLHNLLLSQFTIPSESSLTQARGEQRTPSPFRRAAPLSHPTPAPRRVARTPLVRPAVAEAVAVVAVRPRTAGRCRSQRSSVPHPLPLVCLDKGKGSGCGTEGVRPFSLILFFLFFFDPILSLFRSCLPRFDNAMNTFSLRHTLSCLLLSLIIAPMHPASHSTDASVS